MILVAFVATIIVTDWRWRRIPNAVTYPTMAIGLLLGAAERAGRAGFPGGLKAGDGKFLMAVGALKGTQFLFVAAVYGALIGGLIAIGFIVARRAAAARAGTGETVGGLLHTWIPYGVALGLGALVALGVELSRLS